MRTQRWTAVRTGEVTPDTDLLGEGEEIAGANPGIDAGGLPALPGIVDPYPGFQLDTGRARIVDDLESASMAAAAGGATTCIGFAARLPDQRPPGAGERRRRGAEGRSHLDLGTHLGLAFRYQGSERDLERVLEEEVTGVRMHTTCRGTIVDVDDWTWLRLLRRSGSGRLPVRVHAESDDILGDRRRERRWEGKAWFARRAQSRPAVAIAAAMPRAGARDGMTSPRPAPASLRWSRRRPCSARPGWRGVASGFGGRSGWRLGPGPGLRTVATRRRSRPEFDADVRSRAVRAAAGRGCGGVW
jgi:dihydroorotase-like cyclic amidohydrolase